MTRCDTLLLKKGTIALLLLAKKYYAVAILDNPRARQRWLALATPNWTLFQNKNTRFFDNSRPLNRKERYKGWHPRAMWRVERIMNRDELPTYLHWAKTPAFDHVLKGERP